MKRIFRAMVLLVLAGSLWGCGEVDGIQPVKTQPVELLKLDPSAYPEVAAYVRCQMVKGQIRDGVKASSFGIREGDVSIVPKDVEYVNSPDVRRNVVFVLDNVTKERTAAVRHVVQNILGAMRETDKVAFVAMEGDVFGTGDGQVRSEEWMSKEHFLGKLSSVGTSHKRPLCAALVAALKMAESEVLGKTAQRNTIVMVLAGEDYLEWDSNKQEHNTQRIDNALKRSGVPVHIIGVPVRRVAPKFKSKGLLDALANASRGQMISNGKPVGSAKTILSSMDQLCRVEYRSLYSRNDDAPVPVAVTHGQAESVSMLSVPTGVVMEYVREEVLAPLRSEEQAKQAVAIRGKTQLELAEKSLREAKRALGQGMCVSANKYLDATLKSCEQVDIHVGTLQRGQAVSPSLAMKAKLYTHIPEVKRGYERVAVSLPKKSQEMLRGNSFVRKEAASLSTYVQAVSVVRDVSTFNSPAVFGDFVEYMKSSLPKPKAQLLYDQALRSRLSQVDEMIKANRLQQADEAVEEFLSSLADVPGVRHSYLPTWIRAAIQVQLGKPKKAISFYEKSLATGGDTPEVMRDYLSYLFRQGQDAHALAWVKKSKAISARPEVGRKSIAEAIIRRCDKTPSTAVSLAEESIRAKLVRESELPTAFLARAMARTQKREGALRLYRTCSVATLPLTDRIEYARCLESVANHTNRKAIGKQMINLLQEQKGWVKKWPQSTEKQKVAKALDILGRGYYLAGNRNATAGIYSVILEHVPDYALPEKYQK